MTDLRRHVPRVVLTWDDEVPGARWRTLDGTLMFADISGFTALTEKLSKRGRIGAEEIVDTLNRVFGGMLDTAFAMMSLPTVLTALLLSPRVLAATRDYFERHKL